MDDDIEQRQRFAIEHLLKPLAEAELREAEIVAVLKMRLQERLDSFMVSGSAETFAALERAMLAYQALRGGWVRENFPENG